MGKMRYTEIKGSVLWGAECPPIPMYSNENWVCVVHYKIVQDCVHSTLQVPCRIEPRSTQWLSSRAGNRVQSWFPVLSCNYWNVWSPVLTQYWNINYHNSIIGPIYQVNRSLYIDFRGSRSGPTSGLNLSVNTKQTKKPNPNQIVDLINSGRTHCGSKCCTDVSHPAHRHPWYFGQ